MNNGLHPLAAPFPPLQRVGLFAASSVRALADFAALNAAARECVTQMGVRDRALPGALLADMVHCSHRELVKCAWECEALADALVPAAQQLGIDAAQVEVLIPFRDVGNLPASWSLATPLEQWEDVDDFTFANWRAQSSKKKKKKTKKKKKKKTWLVSFDPRCSRSTSRNSRVTSI
jgi:hypothetical protein